MRFSFNLNAEFEKQLKISHTECEDEGQHKRKERELGREETRYWFFTKTLVVEA